MRNLFLFLILCFQMACAIARGPASEDETATAENLADSEMHEDFDARVEKRLSDDGARPNPEDERNTIGLSWPLKGRVTREYNMVTRKPHLGLDIAAPRGTPILSSHDGIVIYAGAGFHGYGKLVMVEYGDRWATFYSHLSKINVREGQWVKRGQKLGIIGRTGNATGIHLHYEIRYKRDPIDPMKYLPAEPSLIAYYR